MVKSIVFHSIDLAHKAEADEGSGDVTQVSLQSNHFSLEIYERKLCKFYLCDNIENEVN
jgi:hypothetical protein